MALTLQQKGQVTNWKSVSLSPELSSSKCTYTLKMIYVHEGSRKSLVNFASKNKKKADFSVYEFEASGFSE